MKPLSIILIFLTIALEAIYEGLEFRGKKELAKIIQGLWILVGFCIWKYVPFDWWLVGLYLLFRLDFFNIIWNLVTGQKWCYVGVGWYDRNIGKYFMTAPVWMGCLFLTLISILKYKEK